jgi:prepilin-type N-terminal cleavage/methylation domain-containing protein
LFIKHMKLSSAKRGFTLIELLVVIAIIGILSSVVLASLGTARLKARDATRISDLKNVQLALELYFDSNQSYPATGANARLSDPATGAGTMPYDAGPIALNTPIAYIPAVPTDPTQAAALGYRYAGLDDSTAAGTDCAPADTNACLSYVLAATLERADNPVLTGDTDLLLGNLGPAGAPIRTAGVLCSDAADAGAGLERCLSYRP